MDLKMLLEKQQELDKTILKNAGIKEYPLSDMKLALLVELGELANEWQGFKHWKKHKEVDREKLLEEFADCLSFALSLENHLKQITKTGISVMPKSLEKLNSIALRFRLKNNGSEDFLMTYEKINNDEMILGAVLVLGICLNINLDEMQESYLKKNKINWERQEKGY